MGSFLVTTWPANTLTGTTLAANVVTSSLTSLGTVPTLTLGTAANPADATADVVWTPSAAAKKFVVDTSSTQPFVVRQLGGVAGTNESQFSYNSLTLPTGSGIYSFVGGFSGANDGFYFYDGANLLLRIGKVNSSYRAMFLSAWVSVDYYCDVRLRTNNHLLIYDINQINPVGLKQSSAGNLIIDDGASTTYWIVGSGGIQAGTDNTYDIGASGATRPRTVYAGTGVNTPLVTNTAGALAYTSNTNANHNFNNTGWGVSVTFVMSGGNGGWIVVGCNSVVHGYDFAAFGGSADVALCRIASRVIGVADANNGSVPCWIQNTGGEAALNAAFTNSNGTLTATNLSFTLIAGRSYRIHGILQVSNSFASDGVQINFAGGTATITAGDFFVGVTAIGLGTTVAVATVSTTLAGIINYSTITGTEYLVVDGYIKCLNAGTFIMKAATNTTTSGTMTLGLGSNLALSDTVRV
jgi:hypothetical protein